MNPSTVYWIFSQKFVVKIAMFASKDENKLKTGRGWPIVNKSFSMLCVRSYFSTAHT